MMAYLIDLRRSPGWIYEGVLDRIMKGYLTESENLTVKVEKVHMLRLWKVFQELDSIRFAHG